MPYFPRASDLRIKARFSETFRFTNKSPTLAFPKLYMYEKVWFPGIDAIVEKRVKRCMACQASTHLPESSMEPLKMSKLPEVQWQHDDIDLCGPFHSRTLFVSRNR